MKFALVVLAAVFAAVLAVVELGLTAYLASLSTPAPCAVSFMVFNSLWSLLVLAYIGLTPRYYDRIFQRELAFGLEVVTLIFWFSGSIALAVLVTASPNCGYSVPCGVLKTASTLGFFLWLAFTGLAVIDGMEVMRARRSSIGPHKAHQPSVSVSTA